MCLRPRKFSGNYFLIFRLSLYSGRLKAKFTTFSSFPIGQNVAATSKGVIIRIISHNIRSGTFGGHKVWQFTNT